MKRKQAGPAGLYTLPDQVVDPARAMFAGLFVGFFGIFLSIAAGTEFLAWRLGFQRALGAPLFWHIYSPIAGFVWAFKWEYLSNVKPHVFWASMIWILGSGASVIAAGVYTYMRRRGSGQDVDLHGSAHFASTKEVEATGLIGKGAGVYVGAYQDPDSHKIRYLRHDGPEHVLAFAPTRSGKGVGLVIPTLLSWPHSTLVHDIKGENYGLTSGWRSSPRSEGGAGNVCILFDPTESTSRDNGPSARFNPLEEIRLRTDQEVKDVQNIATMIVDPDGKGLNDHWAKTGFSLLVGTTLHVLYSERDKTLRGVAAFLSDPGFSNVDQIFETMANADHDETSTDAELIAKGWINAQGAPTRTHPVVAQSAKDMLNKSSNEKSGVLSTAMSFLTLYRDPIVAKNTEVSDFRITDLMNYEKPVSLYLVVPPSDKDRLKPLIRLIINQAVRTLTERMKREGTQMMGDYLHRLLLMIDEFPALGKLDILQESLAFVAGYGIKCYLITQDLSQLHAAYTKDESIVSNCHVRVAYAPNKIETADLLSKMAGISTVRNTNRSYSGSRMKPALGSVNVSDSYTQRPLLTPDEVMSLPAEDGLVFMAGHRPIYGKKILYYKDGTFEPRSKMPPPERTGFTRKNGDSVITSTATAVAASPSNPSADRDFSPAASRGRAPVPEVSR